VKTHREASGVRDVKTHRGASKTERRSKEMVDEEVPTVLTLFLLSHHLQENAEWLGVHH
jgi:hypothetical protein